MTPVEILKQKTFTYKDKNYEVIKIVKLKSSHDMWLDAVEYKPLYQMPLGEWCGSFVRSINDFNQKFLPTK